MQNHTETTINMKIIWRNLYTLEQYTSIDSNVQKVYHIPEPTTENNCNPEPNHYYHRIKHLRQKIEYQYENIL